MAALLLFGNQFHCQPHLLKGWSPPERGFVWTESPACTLRLPKLHRATRLAIQLFGDAFTTPQLRQQRVRVLHVGRLVCERWVGTEHTLAFELEVAPSTADFIDLDLELPDAASPLAAGVSQDVRTLGFSLRCASVTEMAFAPVDLQQDLNLYPAATLAPETRAWVMARREHDVHVVNRICDAFEAGEASTADLVDAYIAGAGSEMHIRLRLAGLINGAPEFAGGPPAVVDLSLQPERVAGLPCRLLGWLKPPSTVEVTVEHLWPESPNELRQTSFPLPYGGTLLAEKINDFSIKSSRAMALAASTYRFVLFDPETKAIYRPMVSQGSSAIAIEGPKLQAEGRVIVLPDRFDGGNVAHLMFDTVTRMLHFIGLHGVRPTDLFYFGGVPLGFHDLVLEAIGKHYGVRPESLFFPKMPVRLTPADGLYWFNDQEAYHHPAQLMHPQSRAVFRQLGELIGAAPNGRKLYLSRSDASLRRIVNEPELMAMLERHGYEFIKLSDYDYRAQVAMVSGAAAIVAPHGMGMTHSIFNMHKPRVVEIFNPNMGSNCYSWMAYALEFDYTPVAGVEVNPDKCDYSVGVAAIEALLG